MADFWPCSIWLIWFCERIPLSPVSLFHWIFCLHPMVCQVKDASEIKQISQMEGLRSMIPRHRRHVVEIGACLPLHAVTVIQQTGQGSGFSCRFGPFLLLRCVIFSMAVFCTHFVHLSEKCKWYGNYNILNIRYLGFHKNVEEKYTQGC